ncbi:MAG: type II toxin-antitoxin system RelE/ParE family toxin [Syntrophobacter sp.]
MWWCIARHNPGKADQFLDKVEERCHMPVRFPRMGISRDELMPISRSFAVENYLIFYPPIEAGIEIIRVMPGMRAVDILF